MQKRLFGKNVQACSSGWIGFIRRLAGSLGQRDEKGPASAPEESKRVLLCNFAIEALLVQPELLLDERW